MADASEKPNTPGSPSRARDLAAAEPDAFGSAMASAARRATSHFAGQDAHQDAHGREGPPDAIELWGRRIGRALSLAVCIGLGFYLYVTYVR